MKTTISILDIWSLKSVSTNVLIVTHTKILPRILVPFLHTYKPYIQHPLDIVNLCTIFWIEGQRERKSLKYMSILLLPLFFPFFFLAFWFNGEVLKFHMRMYEIAWHPEISLFAPCSPRPGGWSVFEPHPSAPSS